MLDFVGNILLFLFEYGIPAAMGLWGIICVGVIFYLQYEQYWNLTPIYPNLTTYNRVEIQSWFGIQALLGFWYFKWLAEMWSFGPQEEGFTHVPATCALFILVICLGAARVMHAFGLPYLVIFLLYLGIALFGV